MKAKIKLAFLRIAFNVVMVTRCYPIWSKLHRLISDRAPRKAGITLPLFSNIDEIVPLINDFVWRPDSLEDAGDAICSPEMVWYRYLLDVDHKIGDCDEFAIFISSVIKKSINAGTWMSVVEDPNLLSTTWMNPDGKVEGHNVCILRVGQTYGFMDYGDPVWCGAKERVPLMILNQRAAKNATLVGWAIHTPDLRLMEYHNK